MRIFRDALGLIRSLPSEFELWVHRNVMRAHAPNPDFVRDGLPYCATHPEPQRWPCENFLRADRAVDAVLERRR